MNILYTEKLPDGRYTEPASLSTTLNSPYHNGPITFTRDYERVFFSGSNQANGKLLKNADKVNNIKLYTARRDGNEWTNAEELPFNNNNYSCGQPSLSVTGDTLFFISDKPGGNGNTDIYMSVNKNGSWSAPINLGANINTPGAEMFPNYVQNANGKSYLYFSSDGLPGMGGLDLYCSEQLPDGAWGVPVHLDAPLNSSKDDFNLIFNADNTTGYFSSSRDEDKDKLFMFSRITEVFAKVAVHDRKTNELLISALVEINNQTTGKKELLYTDSTGKLYIPLTRDALYAFNATKENFVPGQSFASTYGEKGGETIEVRIDLETPPPPPPPAALRLIALPAAVSNIYYDLNKWNIRRDANATLDKLAELMLKDPAMKLDINAHADARGSDQLNMALTKKRAMAVVEYLANAGISRDRLNPRWFGKTQLVIEDSPKDADDTHHQLNRRVEFKQIEEQVILHSDASYTNYH
jgi:outer membrane protein OmpA-like peptidoglycan-associated protein